MPPFNRGNGGVSKTKMSFRAGSFLKLPAIFAERNLVITGVTKDSTGAALGGCTVILRNTYTKVESNSCVSDAAGNFTLDIPKGLSQVQTEQWQLIAKDSAGTLVGITLDNLQGA